MVTATRPFVISEEGLVTSPMYTSFSRQFDRRAAHGATDVERSHFLAFVRAGQELGARSQRVHQEPRTAHGKRHKPPHMTPFTPFLFYKTACRQRSRETRWSTMLNVSVVTVTSRVVKFQILRQRVVRFVRARPPPRAARGRRIARRRRLRVLRSFYASCVRARANEANERAHRQNSFKPTLRRDDARTTKMHSKIHARRPRTRTRDST